MAVRHTFESHLESSLLQIMSCDWVIVAEDKNPQSPRLTKQWARPQTGRMALSDELGKPTQAVGPLCAEADVRMERRRFSELIYV